MNEVLDRKLESLELAKEKESWYLVKQDTDFAKLCYYVSILSEFQKSGINENFSEYFDQKVQEINEKYGLELSKNHRVLRVAFSFGLIKMTSTAFKNATLTDTYREILNKTNGDFKETNLYGDVIERQIEKFYVASSIDEGKENIRKDFQLFPTLLLYKVLIEVGTISGIYSISTNEFRYLVATTKKYRDYEITVREILELRKNPEYETRFTDFRDKFDNRTNLAFKQLPTLDVNNESISIKEESVSLVRDKVAYFENHVLEKSEIVPNNEESYINFLGSTKSLFSFKPDEQYGDMVDESIRKTGGENILVYGVPGSGKSHIIKEEYCNDEHYMERIVFHPEYSNADFIGQILPYIEKDGTVGYKFKSGPFTAVLKKAYNDPVNYYFLIIEELNRGNAAAIFGELFQLLDRDVKGKSEYTITNTDISKRVFNNENRMVYLPSNLYIIASMNTSDQNVFTLDTAFQRRWKMRLVKNEVKDSLFSNVLIADTNVTWRSFVEIFNDIITENNSMNLSTEDKQLGAYFLNRDELTDANQFVEKVVKYLWDDAFKLSRDIVFSDEHLNFEQVVTSFVRNIGDEKFRIFNDDLFEKLTAGN